MRSCRPLAIIPWIPLVILFSAWCAHAKKDGPRISEFTFETHPSNLLYFEDSDVILIHEQELGIVWRTADAGESWEKIKKIKEGEANRVYLHPHDRNVAYILSSEERHWMTTDQGETWESFNTDAFPSDLRTPLSFHAGDSKKILFHSQKCSDWICQEAETYYTTDGFKTTKILRADTRGCNFAHSTPLFTTGKDDRENNRVLCLVRGKYSSWPEDNRLMISDNYFKDEDEPDLEEGRTVKGIIRMAVVKGYIVAAAKARGTSELALYVTDDAKVWHRAVFPHDHRLEEEAYTILESTNYSIQVDVMTTKPSSAMGVLFSSNSNGTYFTELIRHTNRNNIGIVDFEKMANIQGIVLVNAVDNWQEVERTSMDNKKVQSRISFDDGRRFQSIKAGKEDLHLHSVTDMSNSGRVYSSTAPGLVMGVGNTGKYLEPYEQGDLYVSDDAGMTWTLGIKEAHKYEFGDQGAVLVAIYDEGPTDKISYSLNHGQKWTTADLPSTIRAKILTTTPDSTSKKFVLLGTIGGGSDMKYAVHSIDFGGLHDERKCKDKDFEEWYARQGKDGEASCIMGQQQYFRRRKADADCFVDEDFRDPLPKSTACACSKEDFECDYNFIRDGDKCIPAAKLSMPKDACKGNQKTFEGSSGFRLIPGNKCHRGNPDSINLEKDIDRPCDDANKLPVSDKVEHKMNKFQADNGFREFYYLERTESSTGDDETIIMSTGRGKVYITKDHGKTWRPIDEVEDIIAIIPHQYENDAIYFLTRSSKVYYSINRGDTFDSFKAPDPPKLNQIMPLGFHPNHKDWLIWIGSRDCVSSPSSGLKCPLVASYTTDRGDNWNTLVRYSQKCEFIKEAGRGESDKLVYCERYKDERLEGQLELVSSDNWFADSVVHFNDILTFATMSEFIIVANKNADNSLRVDASIDGKTFADALFPKDFNVEFQRAYTVLDSSTHAIFLHVTVSDQAGFEYGKLMKSNSNGTSYVHSISGVNRNEYGYVDFEKMLGLEGVALVNVVDNLGDEGNNKKLLKTMITHNDGAQWAPLKAPAKTADGKEFECDVNTFDKCSLHLHGYTERKNPKNTFSSASAVGLMMGVGNVGEHLGGKADADTFITRDGGVEWHAVRSGNYIWEYGDQGGIIVIVQEMVATKVLSYTLDEGHTWMDYQFSEDDMLISELSTVPSDNSLNFLLWAKVARSGKEVATINIDFSGLRSKICVLNEKDPNDSESDYLLWSPKHPLQDNDCLFGHVAQYHRKKPERECWNDHKIDRLHNIARNCTCDRQDFECDYNYEIQPDQGCRLVDGYEPPDHSQICKDDPNRLSYWKPTGYRRIPLSTCQGGRELALQSTEIACPGHKKEFEKAHQGLRGFGLFVVAVVLPVSIASGIGYYVWRNWDGKFGRIRLGDGTSAFDASQPWIQYPVTVLAAIVAVLAAVPLLISSLWRSVSGMFGGSSRRYTTRQSFARGRGDYAVVDPDEDELLGNDDDEDV